MSEVAEIEKRISLLERDNSDMQMEIDALRKEVLEKDAEISRLENEVVGLEDGEADISGINDNVLLKELLTRYSCDLTMINEMKIEKVFDAWDDFTLEQFEGFTSSLKP